MSEQFFANPLNFNLIFWLFDFLWSLIVLRQNTLLTGNLIWVQDTVKRIIWSWLNCCLEYQLHPSQSAQLQSDEAESPPIFCIAEDFIVSSAATERKYCKTRFRVYIREAFNEKNVKFFTLGLDPLLIKKIIWCIFFWN